MNLKLTTYSSGSHLFFLHITLQLQDTVQKLIVLHIFFVNQLISEQTLAELMYELHCRVPRKT